MLHKTYEVSVRLIKVVRVLVDDANRNLAEDDNAVAARIAKSVVEQDDSATVENIVSIEQSGEYRD